MTGPSPADRLILALADGQRLSAAARTAGMPTARALDVARDRGYPDLDAIRAHAGQIRARTAPDPGDTIMPRKPRHEPVPEPDVDDAITRGARQAEASRAALATSSEARDARAEELLAERAAAEDDVPPECDDDCGGCSCHRSAPCAHCTEDHDDIDGRRKRQPQPAVEATDPPMTLIERAASVLRPSAAGAGLGRSGDLHRDVLPGQPSLAETLTIEQRARVLALGEADDILADRDPTVGDLLTLADWIVTGSIPGALIVRGIATGGEVR